MVALPMLAALLAMNATTIYPDGFKASCTGGEEGSVYFNADHPAPKLQASAASGSIDISRENGKFVVSARGPDLQLRISDGNEWKLQVLKQAPGDLVLSLSMSTMGVSISIYRLRFKGTTGLLSVSSTYYRDGMNLMSDLKVLSCKVQSPAHP
jgi:hypothetical protein